MSTSPLRVFPSWDSPGSRPVGIAVSQLQRGSVMVWRRHTHPTPKHHCHLDTFLYPENAKSFLLFVSFLFLTADLGLGIRSEREAADTVRALPLTLTDWDPVLILVTAEGTQEGMALSSCLAPTHFILRSAFQLDFEDPHGPLGTMREDLGERWVQGVLPLAERKKTHEPKAGQPHVFLRTWVFSLSISVVGPKLLWFLLFWMPWKFLTLVS